jgi:hypothetical protein
LDNRGVFGKLRELIDMEINGGNFALKLFGIGQTWMLIHLALESGNAGGENWRKCWTYFTGSQDTLSSRDSLIILREEKRTLAARYQGMMNTDTTRRHAYFTVMLDLIQLVETESIHYQLTRTSAPRKTSV